MRLYLGLEMVAGGEFGSLVGNVGRCSPGGRLVVKGSVAHHLLRPLWLLRPLRAVRAEGR